MTQASDTARPPQREPAKDHANGVAGGRLVAWIAFAFGSLVSVFGNVLAARVPPAGAGPTWAPRLDTQIGSGVWPLGLLLAVEVLARIRWPGGFWWRVARYGGVGAVALFAAVISYGHIHTVLTAWNYEWQGALVGPLAVDGLMVVAGAALLADHHQSAGGDLVVHPVISDDAELKARARWVFLTNPGIGRDNLHKALNLDRAGDRQITSNRARKILDELKAEADAHPQAATNGT